MPTFEDTRAGYAAQWSRMNITLDRVAAVDQIARKLLSHKTRYQEAERLTGVPWFVIAAWHERESSANFSTQLAQGDPLNRRSTHVPAGRGPFNTWEDGAYDALVVLKGLDKIKEWPIERIAFESERYNGWGYRNHGTPSAYLWSFSDIYKGGKYVADGVWSSTAVDKQVGVMPLIKRMAELDSSIKIGATTTTPAPPSPPAEQPDFFAAMRAKGIEPDTTDGDLNILYVAGMNPDFTRNQDAHNTWSDLRLVLGHNGQVLGKWRATIDPGDHYVKNRINPAGAANITFGKQTAWQVGLHRGYEALVQTGGPVTVTSDDNEDFSREGDPSRTGWFGINQHHGWDAATPDRQSAGCLVGQSVKGHQNFMAMVKRDHRYKANPRYVFSTTILSAADVEKEAARPAVAQAAAKFSWDWLWRR